MSKAKFWKQKGKERGGRQNKKREVKRNRRRVGKELSKGIKSYVMILGWLIFSYFMSILTEMVVQ